jgi:hypothetical protein
VRKQYLLSVQKAYKAKCCLVVLKLLGTSKMAQKTGPKVAATPRRGQSLQQSNRISVAKFGETLLPSKGAASLVNRVLPLQQRRRNANPGRTPSAIGDTFFELDGYAVFAKNV